MTREETLLKLLAVEPERRDEILKATGWPHDEAGAVLDQLVRRGLVTYRCSGGTAHGGRWYYLTGVVRRGVFA